MSIIERAIALYRPPFRYDGIHYIWDANGEVVADFGGRLGSLRVRGWGRISYMTDAERLHATLEEIIIAAVSPRVGATPEDVAELLTAFWEAR